MLKAITRIMKSLFIILFAFLRNSIIISVAFGGVVKAQLLESHIKAVLSEASLGSWDASSYDNTHPALSYFPSLSCFISGRTNYGRL